MARALGFACVAALTIPLLGCGSWFGGGQANSESWALQSAGNVPAASGRVTVSQTDKQNHVVDVTVQHLAHPSDAFPGTSTYVVWLEPTAQGGPPQNLGVLQLGSNLAAHFKAHTPYRSFRVVITAEQRPNVTVPSDNRVLATAVALPS
jgi:hypothetical protein